MWITVLGAIILFLYLALNFLIAMTCTSVEMRNNYIKGQCLVGKIFTNVFYAPAWLLKGIRFVIVNAIA